MKKPPLRLIPVLAFLLASSISNAISAKQDRYFGDNMVLQSGMPVPVWGTATPGEKVTVEFAGQAKSAEAGADGAWRVALDPLEISTEPREMKVSGGAPIKGVLVGEVWLCAGQSNMMWGFKKGNRVENAEAEIAAANHPLIRNCGTPWDVCSPQTLEKFAAVPYFFARKLTQELGVPVGIVLRAQGGTNIEAWSPREALQKSSFGVKALQYSDSQAYVDYARDLEAYEKQFRAWKEANDPGLPKPQWTFPKEIDFFGMRHLGNKPTSRYEAYIKPVVGTAIRGVIWYQGESNAEGVVPAERLAAYAPMLNNMVSAWRASWGQGDFPFLCVQLPNFGKRHPVAYDPESGWPVIREQIAKAVTATPNMQYVVTIDTVGETGDLHPAQKAPVGERLGLMALREVYGKKDVVAKGPVYRAMKREGAGLLLEFDNSEGGLKWRNGNPANFVIAGADRKFVPATAEIVKGGVLVSSPEVNEAVAVRYAWGKNPEAPLCNQSGLPASPFRTDEWPLFKENEFSR